MKNSKPVPFKGQTKKKKPPRKVEKSVEAKVENVKMADPKFTMEVPSQIREFAEKTIEQAEKGFGAFIDAANKSVDMVPGPATDMSRKALSMTEQNLKLAFDHARRMLNARDIQEAVQIQTEFLKAQYEAATKQLRQFGGSAASAAKDAA